MTHIKLKTITELAKYITERNIRIYSCKFYLYDKYPRNRNNFPFYHYYQYCVYSVSVCTVNLSKCNNNILRVTHMKRIQKRSHTALVAEVDGTRVRN